MTAILDGFPDQGRAVGEFQLLLIFVCLLCCCRECSTFSLSSHACLTSYRPWSCFSWKVSWPDYLTTYILFGRYRMKEISCRLTCLKDLLLKPHPSKALKEQENCLSSLVLILSFLFSGFNSRPFSLCLELLLKPPCNDSDVTDGKFAGSNTCLERLTKGKIRVIVWLITN